MTMLFRGRFKVFLPCSRNFLHKFTLQCRVCFDFADDSSSKTFNCTFRILKVLKLYKGQGFGPTFVVSNSQLLDILNSEKRNDSPLANVPRNMYDGVSLLFLAIN